MDKPRAVRKVAESIYYNPETGSYTVIRDGCYVGSTPHRDIADKWAG